MESKPRNRTQLTLPWPPSVNHYYLRLSNGRLILSPEGRAFRDEAKYRANQAVDYIFHMAVGMQVDLYRPTKHGDIDNPLKACLDSLIGIAYDDDKQVTELHVYRYDDKDNPRVEVTIWQK